MAFGRREVEEVVTDETKIWECEAEDCNGWMRDNFKSSETPSCPLCKCGMKQSTKVIAVVNNHSQNQKM
ncbi:cold-shock protein [Sutcliffiella deserti]|uniref:cold-shock protein n=1 Tax=Sutcliffiella deserti TaxID=2875501 RepID=UPI001CBBFD0A|nr:cold-shock protein [Sutcliffiella deserti]